MTHRGLLLLACTFGTGCVVHLPSIAYDVAAAAAQPRPAAANPPAAPPAAAPQPASVQQAGRTPAGASASPYASTATSLYGPDEALADARSGPLEIVGVGEWPGLFRRLSCVYRNGRVFVVDERCSDPREPTGLVVHVLSPSRGRATLYAEAAGPIGGARRPDYQAIGVASTVPRPAPASLSVAMGYEEVIAHENAPVSMVRGTCSAGTQRPEGHCSKGVATTAAQYAAAVEPFVRAPPAGWYDLVDALVKLRVQAHAAIRPAALPRPRLLAWGASWGRDQDITVDEAALKRVGNEHGRSAAMAVTADGGLLIAGTTEAGGATVPGVVRVDANGAKRWKKALPERGFVTHEIASVAALPDGAILLSPGYDDPGWKPKARVIRLDDRGNVRWQWIGRGKDRHKIPQVVTVQPTPQGTFLLRGYIQLVADGDVHGWNAELDAKGKTIREEVGEVLPDHGASFE